MKFDQFKNVSFISVMLKRAILLNLFLLLIFYTGSNAALHAADKFSAQLPALQKEKNYKRSEKFDKTNDTSILKISDKGDKVIGISLGDAINITNSMAILTSYLIEIVLLLLAIMTLISFLSYKVILHSVSASASKELDEKISKIVSDKTEFAKELVRGSLYMQMAYNWYLLFDNDYQSLVKGEGSATEELKRYTSYASQLTSQGIKSLFKKDSILYSKMQVEGDADAFKLHLNLKSDWVYHRTAEIFSNEINDDFSIAEVIQEAYWCISALDGYHGKGILNWYLVYHTSGITLLLLGNEKQKDEGRKILKDLILGNSPKNKIITPIEFRREIWRECFLNNKENYKDYFSLGDISCPEEQT